MYGLDRREYPPVIFIPSPHPAVFPPRIVPPLPLHIQCVSFVPCPILSYALSRFARARAWNQECVRVCIRILCMIAKLPDMDGGGSVCVCVFACVSVCLPLCLSLLCGNYPSKAASSLPNCFPCQIVHAFCLIMKCAHE